MIEQGLNYFERGQNSLVRACLKATYGSTMSRGLIYPSSSIMSDSSETSEKSSPAACFSDFSRSRAPWVKQMSKAAHNRIGTDNRKRTSLASISM